MSDWTGNNKSIYVTLGASNHTDKERQNEDYYATDPVAAKMLLEIEDFDKNILIWECASGENHLADVFKENGYTVRTSDIIARTETTEVFDFLSNDNNQQWNGHIITNPPYKYAKEFVEKAMELIPDGCKVGMFLKLQFMEGKSRKQLFKKYPPKIIHVSSSRIMCAKNGEFKKMIDGGGSAVAYGWYIWEKGYQGDTIIKWFN